MSDLKSFVPPMELCQQIPEGEFGDSALIWLDEDMVIERDLIGDSSGEIPAPTLEEILEELRKNQEDVFLKWSPKAYHSWLVNAYTHDKEDYQDHNSSAVTAALKVWLKLKGIEDGK